MFEEHIRKFTARFAGWGGQGNIMAGMVLSQAATFERKYVVQTQNHGAQQQGGVSRSDVVISDSQINFPEADAFNVLVALNQEVLDKFGTQLKSNNLLIVDTTYCDRLSARLFYLTKSIVAYPFSRKAEKLFGKEVIANIIALGVIARHCDVVKYESVKQAVAERVPKAALQMNMEALELGYNMEIQEMSLDESVDLKTLARKYL
ncbi:MAG: 2-oxoacid:ferredoxin oxidoreductase subunit gamma [Candidatus Wallbacteria bacterium HGW-Wallbacteria-1]|jgi:2-oxoglutarate ferredoxin oxidoreductase subunit gamma|uniref:2-oxoacid:ferredoxin oxidoreductase subunit gamma n=1 Tax=Candidatus Wallbacteria bacterium HGW-Wallbacteria-1 TaxID=2013854 RepID=A0A2N1PIJ9_9BACT|nr:MAG: 2-oxoacid:ferredoxin oxidoreductase subunit gamma [Candidatus Wallbacteria bacterium HGW-Wallbacteria-1]